MVSCERVIVDTMITLMAISRPPSMKIAVREYSMVPVNAGALNVVDTLSHT